MQPMFKDFGRLVERNPQINVFAVLMVWREPRGHIKRLLFLHDQDHWFRLYPNIPFALRPVPHDDSMPLPKLTKSYTLDSDSESEEDKK
jgi:hypothetical protein